MKTGIRRGLRSAFAGSLLLGTAAVASVFAASVPASGSPTYTPAVTNTVPVGTSPHDVAVDPDTGTVYVANNYNPGTVSVISEATDTVTKTIAVASYPSGVAVDPTTGTVYVGSSNGGANIGTVSVISEATGTVTGTIAMGSNPVALAVDPDTGTLYVTGNNGYTTTPGFVSVISEATDTVTNTITVGDFPQGVAVDPHTGIAYVANLNSDDVSVINGGTVTNTIPVGTSPEGVAVDPGTGNVYVVNSSSHGTVSVISEATDTVTNAVDVGKYPFGVAVDPDTGTVYVANEASYTASLISEATDKVTNTLDVGQAPVGVAADPHTDTAYVTNFSGNSVSVIGQTVTDDYRYAAGGGTGTAPAAGGGLDGTTITLAANTFTYPGHTFAGWSDGTSTYPAGASYTLSSNGAPIVFTAQWTENTIDTVAFDSDGGAAVASLSGPDGSSITLPSDTYPSYAPFEGWFTASSGGTEVGGAGSSYTIPMGGITLYAQWTARRPNVIAVSPNAGPTKGGTAITISGGGFVSGTTVVIGQGNGTAGAIAATDVVIHSATKITAVTGGGATAGVFNLFVTTARGTSAANYAGDEFNYDALPTVTGVSPNAGSSDGRNSHHHHRDRLRRGRHRRDRTRQRNDRRHRRHRRHGRVSD